MRKAYSYVRFSRPDQITGDSLRRQTERSRSYCQRNGLMLDESLTLHDLGVSAFRGKNADTGALSGFLRAIESGNVPQGSVLIVESLDRLSRQKLREARDLFESILERGINIVTLSPEREYTTDSLNDIVGIIEPLLYLSRANEESEIKSHRLKSVWTHKRKIATDEKMTAKCPGWLKLSKDRKRFEVIPDRAKTVKRIFQMSADGYGATAIVKELNGKGIKPFGCAKQWHRSTIQKILAGRQVLGELQPTKHHPDGTREPVGDVITDYYPAVIDESLYYRAQHQRRSRSTQPGKQGRFITNLFTGLVFSARDGSPLIARPKRWKRASGEVMVKQYLVTRQSTTGVRKSEHIGYAYKPLEAAVLRWLIELAPTDLFGATDNTKAQKALEKAQGDKGKIESRIAQIKKRMADVDDDSDYGSLIDVLSDLDAKRDKLSEQIEGLRRDIHNAQPSGMDSLQWVTDAMQEAKGDELIAIRRKLKAIIRQLIDKIIIDTKVVRHNRFAFVELHLYNGKTRKLKIVCNRHSNNWVEITVSGDYKKDPRMIGDKQLSFAVLD